MDCPSIVSAEVQIDQQFEDLNIDTSRRFSVNGSNIIDKFGPDGISKAIKFFSNKAIKFQSGFIYQYAFIMLLGFTALLTFLIVK